MNGLEERVGTLLDGGRADLASDLLRASYHSRGIDNVVFVDDDRVQVVSGPFRGEHDVEVDDDGSVDVDVAADYRFEGDDVETEFRVRSLTDAELQTIRRAVRPDDDGTDESAADPSAGADPEPAAGTEEPPVLADGGRSASSSSSRGLRERVSAVLETLRP